MLRKYSPLCQVPNYFSGIKRIALAVSFNVTKNKDEGLKICQA